MSDLDEAVEFEEAKAEGLRRHFRRGGFANDSFWGALHDVSQLAVMTTSFLILGRQLGVSDYGRYVGLFGIVGPIGGMSWSGITLAVLHRRLHDGDPPERVARDFFGITMGMAVLAVTVGTVVGSLIIHGLPVHTVVAIMTAELFANAMTGVSTAMVQAEKGFAPATRLRLVVLAIRLTVLLTLTVTGSLTIANLGIGYTIGFLVYLSVLLTKILPGHGIPFVLGTPQSGTGGRIFQTSLPIAVGVLQQDGDKAVLNAFRFSEIAGLYGAAFRVVSMGLMPLRAIEGAAFQRFLPHDEGARNQHVRRAARFSALTLAISIVIGIGILVASPLVGLVLGKEFKAAESMIPWLLPFLPLTALSNAPSNALMGLGRLGARAAVYVGGAVTSLTLYIVLIPRMAEPWKGAVVGTIVGEAFLVVAGWTALRHYQRIHNEGLDDLSV